MERSVAYFTNSVFLISQGNCPFHEMDNPTVHFVKWTNRYIFCCPFHEMDKVMYES